MIEIRLNLEDHCIETEIKKQYELRISLALKKGLTKQLEREIEGLRQALEEFDFKYLRSHHRKLAGGVAQWAVLEIPPVGEPGIRL